MNFWDTSAIIALVTDEALAPVAGDVLEADRQLAVWWGTSVECAAALARKEREGAIMVDPATDPPDAMEWARRLDVLALQWYEVQPDRRIQALARRLVRVHPLRAADGLQLAAAVALAEDEPTGIGFLSFDAQLNRAASREGFTLPATGAEAARPQT